MSLKPRGDGPVKPTNGWTRTRCLLGLTLLLGFGCATGSLISRQTPFLPTWPEEPILRMMPRRVTIAGQTYQVIRDEDWLALSRYYLEVERQLTASCLALGGSKVQCHAETP